MFRKLTPEKAIAFTKLIVAVAYCWPLPPTSTKYQVFRFKIARSAIFLNTLVLFFPLLYAIHVHRDDPENVSKAVCFSVAVSQTLLQTIIYIIQYDRFQRLIEEMNVCCLKATSQERHVFQRYVNKFSKYYGVTAAWFYLTAIIMILGTLVIAEPFPTNAEYPFLVDFEPVRSIIFLHQALAGIQCAAHVCVSIFCALLLLFSAARFEILMIQLRAVENIAALVECVRMYHAVKRYANEVIRAIRCIVLLMVLFCLIAAVFAGINFIGGKQSFTVNVQFLLVTGTAFLEVFMCAWPADHLIDISENALGAAYDTFWHGWSVRMQKSILLTLIPLSPVAIRFSCVIPIFSLNYYCSFISNVFSLFTALRVALVKDEDNM